MGRAANLTCLAILAAVSSGCASRSDSLAPVWSDPWAHHGRVLEVLVYPYDTDGRRYLACDRPCPNPTPKTLGNNWIVPLDDKAFVDWKGMRAVRMRVRINALSFGPNGFWGHLPIFLEEAPANDEPSDRTTAP